MEKARQARFDAAAEEKRANEQKEQLHYETLGTVALAQAKAESLKAKEMKLKTATKIAEQMKRERELRVVQDRERWDQKVRNASDQLMPRGKRIT